MNLSEFSVKRWQLTLVVFLALAALGVNSFFSIPKAEDPTFPLATFAIAAVLPGATPVDVERLVVDPIETKMKGLDDVKKLVTEIRDGLAVIRVEFLAGVDPDRKHDEVLRETAALRGSLPAELVRLDVQQFNAANVNIREVALVADDAPYKLLDVQARALKRRLESLPGVGDVTIAGLPEQEVTVALDLPKMVARGISVTELLSAIGGDSQNVPAGSVEAGPRRFSVKTTGDYASLDEIRTTVVRAVNGAAVRVEDVATVELADAEASQVTRFDGRRAVLVAAAQKEGQNIFVVEKAIDAELAAFARTLPPPVKLASGFDQSRNVAHRMGGFSRDFGLAILLVLVTLLPLGVRASVIVMVSVPLSLAVALVLLEATGFSINQLSIVGFVIALGLLVDDSVVVVENISRFLRAGHSPRQAAILATKQITVSVLGCTATLIFAFLPLLALPGNAGQFIRSMPVAVVFTIAASLFVSLTVVPFLASRLLKSHGEHGNVFLRALNRGIEVSYRPVLGRALSHPFLTLASAAALLLGALSLVPSIGFSLFPKAGVPQFLVTIETDDGASFAETDRAARFVEGVLARRGDVHHMATSVGKGHPQIYYNIGTENERTNLAEVFAEFRGEPTREAFEQLRRDVSSYPGAKIRVREFENGPPLEAPIAIRLLGDDEASLSRAAADVEKVVRSVEGTRDVKNPSTDRRTDLRVSVDREKAAVLGVAPFDVDRAVRLAVGGVVAGKYREDSAEEAYDIRVTLPRNDAPDVPGGRRPALDVLERIYVPAARGAVPLLQVASLVLEPSPATIRHHDKERSVTVTAEVKDGFNTDKLTQKVLAALATKTLPAGVRYVAGGEVENRKESFGGLGSAILIAAFGILGILVLEFRTFKGTLIVASVIPLGVIGGLLALYLTGNSLSFTATIGFVALMGIEVKNSILLVDFTNQLREQGVGLDEAIQKAGEARFVPILLTTLTAIGGLVPLVLEHSSLYSPLALVILGGLVSSTILTRVVTPVLYKLLAPAVGEDEEGAAATAVAPIAAAAE